MRHESIRELEEQQNKKRRIREETRGQAEDRIAMQLATDESLAAEMEEEGEEDKGTIDAAGQSDNQYEKFRRGRDLWEEVEEEEQEEEQEEEEEEKRYDKD